MLLTPHIHIFSNNRLAGVDIDELYINVQGNSSLVFDNVFSDTLACDVCKSGMSALTPILKLCNFDVMTHSKVQEFLRGLAHRKSCQKTEPTDQYQRQYDLAQHDRRSWISQSSILQ